MKRQRISPVWWARSLRRWLTGHAPSDQARLIHRDRDLAVAWLPGTTKRLVLVFISITHKSLHPDRLEFRANASDNGKNHVLFINDRWWSWYSRPGLRDKIAELVRKVIAAQGIESVWSIGNSMGGYGAILFRDRLPISKVVAFVPQILLRDEVIDRPTWAANRHRIMPEVERDLTPIMAAKATEFDLVYGDSDEDDQIQLGHLRQRLPDASHVRIVIVPGQKHNVARWLKAQGQLAGLTSALWTGDRTALEGISHGLETPLDLTLA